MNQLEHRMTKPSKLAQFYSREILASLGVDHPASHEVRKLAKLLSTAQADLSLYNLQPTSHGAVLLLEQDGLTRTAHSLMLHNLGFAVDVLDMQQAQPTLSQALSHYRAIMLSGGPDIQLGWHWLQLLKSFEIEPAEPLPLICFMVEEEYYHSAIGTISAQLGANQFLELPLQFAVLHDLCIEQHLLTEEDYVAIQVH